ncbi:hypothetical protein A2483_00745 [Candidatus Peregrinibacteria bacterium RIFOXYC2_FULL_33_13]|nr:MAG: hypothetical protein UR27_C0003G0094 [Candidatus Peregrinibacteria bacterium GW2011_GWA2_33_10]KKP40820.1 MAG: hypothetical protein UR30_C0004G0078 [Candidatus Peregrinibacteria bacterium GW2011_GWC2_33_13]OGJ48021.1 MAG: hypothetical protein A2229_03225 [Candidatus Peregrinibacteria bacterium RIFOXYA2_FULL_33_7]OGJ52409.1 MAG: hypothetical protein A2483_00745 [Candidatus Peregrinibacteria bacterium RIFOXYC2_FULL_33_13]
MPQKILLLAFLLTLSSCSLGDSFENVKNTATETIDSTVNTYEETKNKVNETISDVEEATNSVTKATNDVQEVFE